MSFNPSLFFKKLFSVSKKRRARRSQAKQRLKNLKENYSLHYYFGGERVSQFHGGLHLELGKHLTNRSSPQELPEQVKYYLLSMQMHKGPKTFPLVREGEEVKAGQYLTSQATPGHLPIHSPVEGKIVAIQDYLYASPLTKTSNTIVIKNKEFLDEEEVKNQEAESNTVKGKKVTLSQASSADYQYPPINHFNAQDQGHPIGPQAYQPLDYFDTPTLDLLFRVKYAGIAGLGGAVFPSARKINRKFFKTLLVNACECEPYITCDDMMMQSYAQEVIKALITSAHLMRTAQVIVAVEDDKPLAVVALREALASLKEQQAKKLTSIANLDLLDLEQSIIFKRKTLFTRQHMHDLEKINNDVYGEFSWLEDYLKNNNLLLSKEEYKDLVNYYLLHRIKIRVIPTVYPSGNQRTTIQVLTGAKMSKRQSLTTMGAICFNIATIYSIHRAINYGEVLTQRLVTVTGQGIAQAGNYWLPFGVTPAFLAQKLGTTASFTGKVIMALSQNPA